MFSIKQELRGVLTEYGNTVAVFVVSLVAIPYSINAYGSKAFGDYIHVLAILAVAILVDWGSDFYIAHSISADDGFKNTKINLSIASKIVIQIFYSGMIIGVNCFTNLLQLITIYELSLLLFGFNLNCVAAHFAAILASQRQLAQSSTVLALSQASASGVTLILAFCKVPDGLYIGYLTGSLLGLTYSFKALVATGYLFEKVSCWAVFLYLKNIYRYSSKIIFLRIVSIVRTNCAGIVIPAFSDATVLSTYVVITRFPNAAVVMFHKATSTLRPLLIRVRSQHSQAEFTSLTLDLLSAACVGSLLLAFGICSVNGEIAKILSHGTTRPSLTIEMLIAFIAFRQMWVSLFGVIYLSATTNKSHPAVCLFEIIITPMIGWIVGKYYGLNGYLVVTMIVAWITDYFFSRTALDMCGLRVKDLLQNIGVTKICYSVLVLFVALIAKECIPYKVFNLVVTFIFLITLIYNYRVIFFRLRLYISDAKSVMNTAK